MLLLLVHPARPTAAVEPTPTPPATAVISPTDQAGAIPCRLSLNSSCDFTHPLEVVGSRLRLKTNPALDVRGVPTYTLISVAFDQEMDPATIDRNSFSISQGAIRLSGAISYISASQVAVFYPATPLLTNTTYTARLSAGVRDRSGRPRLAEDLVWSFTTTADPSPLAEMLAAEGGASAAMNIYFGDLHTHTGYSDGHATPAVAFATGRANGLDFMAVTDHDIMLTETEWQNTLAQANAATVNGQFVALRGFEFTHLKGHMNVFDTATFVRADDPNYDTWGKFYAWLVGQPTAIGQFNHPRKTVLLDWNFNDFAYNPAADQKIVLRELSDATQFYLSLNKGWHLASLGNTDTHQSDWGARRYMGLLAPALTPGDILAALRARRTFFVSPSDPNLALVMRANGYWMGSAIRNTGTVNFSITAYDPDPWGSPLTLILYQDNTPVAQTTRSSATVYNWTPAIPGKLGHYYYVEAYYNGWLYPAYSSPIWVERPPLAQAGSPQTVAPGMKVTLDGRSSSDPDGDALAYQWVQENGPAVSLSQANSARATFTAPAVLGQLTFRLTVTDPGGLSASDQVAVTVTDKPILTISKTGPPVAAAGELITYTLTVANLGVTAASGLVITDALPAGATYVSGGTLGPGQIVAWTIPSLAANGGLIQANFAVTAKGGIANAHYGASCPGCIPATGQAIVFTFGRQTYMPTIFR